MKKRIVIFCTLLTIAALAIAGVISMLAVEQRYLKEARTFLVGTMDVTMSYPIKDDEYDAVAHDKAEKMGNGVRITFISFGRQGVGDSEAEAGCHAQPLRQGRSEGGSAKWPEGEDIRYSNTAEKDTDVCGKKIRYGCYCAVFHAFGERTDIYA